MGFACAFRVLRWGEGMSIFLVEGGERKGGRRLGPTRGCKRAKAQPNPPQTNGDDLSKEKRKETRLTKTLRDTPRRQVMVEKAKRAIPDRQFLQHYCFAINPWIGFLDFSFLLLYATSPPCDGRVATVREEKRARLSAARVGTRGTCCEMLVQGR